MSTIRDRLIERLDIRIRLLQKAQRRLAKKLLQDHRLDNMVKSLLAIREKLRSKDPSGTGE